MNHFERILAPLSSEEFLDKYWEKTYLHQESDEGRYQDYFSMADIDVWLSSVRSGPTDSLVITSPAGGAAQRTSYRPRDISLDRVYLALAQGSSLILNHLEDWPTIMGMVKDLGRFFHADIGVNAYCTPKDGRTFPIHMDSHDVLILHLAGEKVWHLHDLTVLQTPISQKQCFNFPEQWYGRKETPEVAEITLRPGDLLYIPRGMPHYAVAQGATALHLTVSITPQYWMDFLKVAAEYAALYSPVIRRALPPGFVESEAHDDEMRRAFAEVLEDFRSFVDFDEVLMAVRRNRAQFQGLPADGHFVHVSSLEGLTINTKLERRPHVTCAVGSAFDDDRNEKSAIYFANQRVLGPPHLVRALKFIRDTPGFRVSEIPGLDEKGQMILARRLLLEGLLRLAGSVESPADQPALALT